MASEPKDFSEMHQRLSQETNKITHEVWSYLTNRIQSIDMTIDLPEINYIVTGVCANVFAHHNALMVLDELETMEHAEGSMPRNFVEMYKWALPRIMEKLKGATNGKP